MASEGFSFSLVKKIAMKTITCLILVGLTASSLPAQTGHHANLEVTGLYGGSTITARLRSTEIGQTAHILFGNAALVNHPLPNPLQLVSRVGGHLFTGVIGADGIFEVSQALPPAPFHPGHLLFGQAYVLHRNGMFQATPRIAVLGETTLTASWTEANFMLPASVSNDLGTDTDVVDYDRDGDLDLVISNFTSLMFLTNDGSGRFIDESALRLPTDNAGAFVSECFDVDLDGDFDIISCGGIDATGASMPIFVYHNNGIGIFSKAQELTTVLPEYDALIIGDFNHDGFLDFLTGYGTAYGGSGVPHQFASVFINNNGTFVLDPAAETAAWNSTAEEFLAGDAGDVDNDGDIDLYFALTGAGGAENRLLLNDGFGNFSDVTATNLPIINFGDGDLSSDATLVDVNSDGYLDIVVANSHLSLSAADSGDLLLNNGATAPGTFVDAPGNLFPVEDPDCVINLGVTTGDVDLDGDIDLVIHPCEWFGSGAFPFVGHPILFLNQGHAQGGVEGVFVRDYAFWTPGPFATFFSYYGSLFDADGDGDLDLYTPSMGGIVDMTKTQDYFMSNLLR